MSVNVLKYIDSNKHCDVYNKKVVVNKYGGVITDQPNELLQSFYSEEPKMVFYAFSSYFHFIHDFLAPLLYFYEQNRNTLFLIFLEEISVGSEIHPICKKQFDLLETILKDNQIKHKFVDLKNTTALNIDNYKKINVDSSGLFNSDDIIFRYIKRYIKNPDIKPFRKAYISRSLYAEKTKGVKFEQSLLNNNIKLESEFDYPETKNRLDDDRLFDEYMNGMGYEVICPEIFDNIFDQINYFYECKVISSVTSGGLTNSIFMARNMTMIEFVTPLESFWVHRIENGYTTFSEVPQVEYAHHLFYNEIAGEKRFSYLGIPNFARSSKKLINYISENKAIENYIRSC